MEAPGRLEERSGSAFSLQSFPSPVVDTMDALLRYDATATSDRTSP